MQPDGSATAPLAASGGAPEASRPVPVLARERRGGWLPDRLYAWRNRLLGDAAFQRRMRRNPFTRFMARRRARAMFDLCSGFVYSQVLAAALELELFELLADGPLELDAIARATGLERDAAATLVRSATSLKLLENRGGGRFGLGIHGAALRANPGVQRMIEHHAFLYRDLGDPVALLRNENVATNLSMFWDYDGARRAQCEELGKGDSGPYTELMSASQSMVAEQIVDSYPLRSHQCLLDVGGGDGTFLRSVARSAPDLSLILFDLPPVACRAEARFAESGLPNPARCVGGSMFEDELPTGADVVSLVRVVHDHDDAEALELLGRCRRALPDGGTLLLAEPMAREGGGDRATDAYFGFYLQAMGRGRPRTASELGDLLERAGFERVREVRTHLPMLTSLLVARAAPRANARVDSPADGAGATDDASTDRREG